MASATTIRTAATANVIRIPVATVSGRAAVMSLVAGEPGRFHLAAVNRGVGIVPLEALEMRLPPGS